MLTSFFKQNITELQHILFSKNHLQTPIQVLQMYYMVLSLLILYYLILAEAEIINIIAGCLLCYILDVSGVTQS